MAAASPIRYWTRPRSVISMIAVRVESPGAPWVIR